MSPDKKACLLFLFCLFAVTVFSQDLYNFRNSAQFAEYLKQSGQYELAASEYERLVFMRPDSQELKYHLLDCYILANNLKQTIKRANQLQTDGDSVIESYRVWALMKSGNFPHATQILSSSSSLSAESGRYYQAWNLILQDKYREASVLLKNQKTEGYTPQSLMVDISCEGLGLPRRSPAVAGIFSAIVPGTGKMYSGEIKDGAIAFITIGLMSYQAYRGFKRDGKNSVYGWIFGSISTGFYLGNIYGATRSAKRFNERQKRNLKQRIEKDFTVHRPAVGS